MNMPDGGLTIVPLGREWVVARGDEVLVVPAQGVQSKGGEWRAVGSSARLVERSGWEELRAVHVADGELMRNPDLAVRLLSQLWPSTVRSWVVKPAVCWVLPASLAPADRQWWEIVAWQAGACSVRLENWHSWAQQMRVVEPEEVQLVVGTAGRRVWWELWYERAVVESGAEWQTEAQSEGAWWSSWWPLWSQGWDEEVRGAVQANGLIWLQGGGVTRDDIRLASEVCQTSILPVTWKQLLTGGKHA